MTTAKKNVELHTPVPNIKYTYGHYNKVSQLMQLSLLFYQKEAPENISVSDSHSRLRFLCIFAESDIGFGR